LSCRLAALTVTLRGTMRIPSLLLATLLAACGSSTDRVNDGFASELEIDPAALTSTPSGLRYQDQSTGEGVEATAGTTAVVHYTGWLTDGKKFDSSRDRGEPFAFRIGAAQVIAGWDEGVAGMKVGGRRKLVVPANLGYGSQGAPPVIPPDATLVFDVELLDVQ
jgi:FKBP-type peptidyl-prolyl cis-trans isomerase FkpA